MSTTHDFGDRVSIAYTPSATQQFQGLADYDITFAGSAVEKVRASFSDGRSEAITFDPLNTQPWDTRTTQTDATGRVTADVFDFSNTVRDFVDGNHVTDLLHLAQLDAAMVDQLMIQIEREALDGGGAGDHVPMPSVYNWDVFNSGYAVFNAGAYNIDFGAFDNNPVTANTSVSLVDVPQTNGIDVSGYAGGIDAWELSGTLTGSPQSFEFSIDFGIFFPLVLDLDGDGVDVLPRMDLTVYFNLDGDAFLEQTAWMGAGDGMLVIDRVSLKRRGFGGHVPRAGLGGSPVAAREACVAAVAARARPASRSVGGTPSEPPAFCLTICGRRRDAARGLQPLAERILFREFMLSLPPPRLCRR